VIEFLVFAAFAVAGVTLLATLLGALSFVGWLITLPFQLIGWVFKAVGFVLALPFMILGLVLGGIGLFVGLGAGALGLAIGLGVLGMLALPLLLPFILVVALVVWAMRSRSPRHA
jgi:hypothetical protein